jgi:hypothetical protein
MVGNPDWCTDITFDTLTTLRCLIASLRGFAANVPGAVTFTATLRKVKRRLE